MSRGRKGVFGSKKYQNPAGGPPVSFKACDSGLCSPLLESLSFLKGKRRPTACFVPVEFWKCHSPVSLGPFRPKRVLLVPTRRSPRPHQPHCLCSWFPQRSRGAREPRAGFLWGVLSQPWNSATWTGRELPKPSGAPLGVFLHWPPCRYKPGHTFHPSSGISRGPWLPSAPLC